MKRTDVIKALILILAIILNSKTIKSMHIDQTKINPDKTMVINKPIASFHKFWADIKWMLFIQHIGSIDLTTDKNSKDLHQKAKDIVELDPGFYKVYELSSLMLSTKAPDLAVDLLKIGQKTHQNKNDWRLFSMAGNIRHQETFFNRNVDKKEKLREAIGFYRLALKKPGVMPVLEKTYIKTRAQFEFERNNERPMPIAELIEWNKYLTNKIVRSELGMKGDDIIINLEDSTKADILSLIQQVKREFPDNFEGKKTSQQMLNSIFHGIHVCGKCYNEYSAGHKFCIECRNPVKVFGVCPNRQCGKVHSNGKFCEHCGTKLRASVKNK